VRQALVIVGGGLQGCLIALAALHHHPGRSITLIERGEALGGNHQWSFHAADLPAAAVWAEPLVERRWPAYDVLFPDYQRTLAAPYATIGSARLDHVVREAFSTAPHAHLLLGQEVVDLSATTVTTGDGRRVHGELVIDARGPGRELRGAVAYQKFLGRTLRVAGPVPPRPVVMDMRVPQDQGLRFVYVLPLAPDRVLIEDTYYDDAPELDRARLRDNVSAYARALGLTILEVEREEEGVLPLPLDRAGAPRFGRPLLAGYAGGWLQPTTGYSFPVAVRLAEALAAEDPEEAVGVLAAAHAKQAPFLRRLNRWLFRAVAPPHRWRLFAKFYRLPEDLIARFYAMQLGNLERWRLLAGAPPKGMNVPALLRGVADA
jgi:lycopene beta-cyclase